MHALANLGQCNRFLPIYKVFVSLKKCRRSRPLGLSKRLQNPNKRHEIALEQADQGRKSERKMKDSRVVRAYDFEFASAMGMRKLPVAAAAAAAALRPGVGALSVGWVTDTS